MQQDDNRSYYTDFVEYRDSVDYSIWGEEQAVSESEPSILVGPDDSDSDNS